MWVNMITAMKNLSCSIIQMFLRSIKEGLSVLQPLLFSLHSNASCNLAVQGAQGAQFPFTRLELCCSSSAQWVPWCHYAGKDCEMVGMLNQH